MHTCTNTDEAVSHSRKQSFISFSEGIECGSLNNQPKRGRLVLGLKGETCLAPAVAVCLLLSLCVGTRMLKNLQVPNRPREFALLGTEIGQSPSGDDDAVDPLRRESRGRVGAGEIMRHQTLGAR